jgi:hypothetical protein
MWNTCKKIRKICANKITGKKKNDEECYFYFLLPLCFFASWKESMQKAQAHMTKHPVLSPLFTTAAAMSLCTTEIEEESCAYVAWRLATVCQETTQECLFACFLASSQVSVNCQPAVSPMKLLGGENSSHQQKTVTLTRTNTVSHTYRQI